VFGDQLTACKKLDYVSTIRGRLGYAFGNALVYGTGGFAYGAVHNRLFVAFGPPLAADLHKDATETGFAADGGIEYMISPRFSVKAEYQFVDLGSEKLSAPVVPPTGVVLSSNRIDNEFQTVRGGLNVHLQH
jgi:outer membrane immunogenic protein